MFLAVVALGCAVVVEGGPSHLHLTVSPAHAHVRPREDLTVMCRASAPITSCQLQLSGVSYDLSLGSATPPRPEVAYSGRGLGAGDCGFTLNTSLVLSGVGSTYPLTCRVRSQDSDWSYGLMAVFVSDNNAIPLSLDKHVMVAQPGSELNVLYRLGGPVTKCEAKFENWNLDRSRKVDLSNKGACPDPNVCSHGNGLNEMECGITIKNVTDKFNGLIWFSFFGPSGKKDESDFVLIIVAKPPASPVLSSDVTVAEHGPAMLRAECRVEGSRPAANISWYLDGEPLRQSDGLRYVADDAWSKLSSKKTTTQTLTRRLSDADVGRELWCVAEHTLLGGPGRSSERVRIHVPTCPPLTSKTLLISCSLGGEIKDCAKRQQIGTVARLSCKPGHLLPHDVIFRTTTCRDTARWDRELFKCSPDCGRRKSNSGSVLVSHGEDSKVGEFPWHVGIYRLAGGNRTPDQICGGSLITDQVVVSAAHCFYDNVLNGMRNSSEFLVAAGKHSREWDEPRAAVQRRNVTSIGHNLYGGRDRSFTSDIALVYLDRPVEVNDWVNVVCVDWNNDFELWQLSVGGIGVVPGWGFTESGSQSDELKYIDLPYVPVDVCYASLTQDLKPILTYDKICAGYRNQSRSVCRGDSGGGLVFLNARNDKYYLRGVVSVAFKPAEYIGTCYSDQYVGFTLVSKFLTWIQENIFIFAQGR